MAQGILGDWINCYPIMNTAADPLETALASLNLRELTGDSRITAREAASLIRESIREHNTWDTENAIWQEVLDGAAALSEARNWAYNPADPNMLLNLVKPLADGKDTMGEYIIWCVSVDPISLHFSWEGPLDDFQIKLMRRYADNLLNLFRQHMPSKPKVKSPD